MIKTVLFREPHIFLTICSVAGQAKFGRRVVNLDRRFVLNWNNFDDFRNGDLIGLFDFDVSKEPREKDKGKCIVELAKESVAVTGPRGSHKTSVRFERKPLSSKGERSLGWWIAFLRFKSGSWTVIKSNCFKIRPTWMRELRDVIGDIPLYSLMLPGTHDAGSYMEYSASCENIYVRYYICQEETIYDQLVYGIRYLDVRVAHYPDTEEKFWVNHDKYRCHPLKNLLSDLRRFVEETKEIVFLDFHNFPIGFNGQGIHEELIEFVMNEIGRYVVPRTYPTSVTPNMLWKANKTIIWTYAENSIVSLDKNKFLWPYLVHAWGNKRKPEHLERYLEEALEKYGRKGMFWSAMAELTPRPIDYISKPKFGLRGFSDWINIPMTYWFQKRDWYSKCMIVSTDFFLGNNIIEMSVEVNRHKVLE